MSIKSVISVLGVIGLRSRRIQLSFPWRSIVCCFLVLSPTTHHQTSHNTCYLVRSQFRNSSPPSHRTHKGARAASWVTAIGIVVSKTINNMSSTWTEGITSSDAACVCVLVCGSTRYWCGSSSILAILRADAKPMF